MNQNRFLHVLYHDIPVGTLAIAPSRQVAFEYDEKWLKNGFSISPFSLPLKKEVFLPSKNFFKGLFGVFADSLPDAWGKLLLEYFLRSQGKNLDSFNILDRLSIIGSSGMGALTYEPVQELPDTADCLDLDDLAYQCKKILHTEYSEKLDELFLLGGSSGGARPKILTEIDKEPWIIKFPASPDGEDAGIMEYEYYLCARECGITMSECRLFPSQKCNGYFGTRRFDRITSEKGSRKIHVLTAAALLELDFTQPSLDYHGLMKLTCILTGSNEQDMENMYRRMCFNVFAHNRDDHSKNFSYLYDEASDSWRLAPAYDLTYSNTYYGEHTTTVDGNGHNPGMKELLAVGTAAGMKQSRCKSIAEDIRDCVNHNLATYLS